MPKDSCLACPKCQGTMNKKNDVCVCDACGAVFIPSKVEGVFVSGSIIGIHKKI